MRAGLVSSTADWRESLLKPALRRLRARLFPARADAVTAMRHWWPDLTDADTSLPEPRAGWPAVVRRVVSRRWLEPAGTWALSVGRVDLAMELASRSVSSRADAPTLRAACRVAYEAARLDRADEWASRLEATGPLGEGDRRLVGAVHERRSVLARLSTDRADAQGGEARRVLSLLAYSLPYTSNGYATRSHGLLTAVRELGWDVHPYTRPGYPGDADPSLARDDLPQSDRVGVLDYGRLSGATRRRLGHMPYLLAAADEIRGQIERLRPQLVHAASNYMTALPACVAAREAGLPFVYEVRGFWDITRTSSDPNFARTTEFRYLRLFETELLTRADAVVTLTQAMRAELIRRGAPADRIEVAPNSVDVGRLDPRPRDPRLAARLGLPAGLPVIGYAGSFVDYEGLDDLVLACAELWRSGRQFRLLLVGDGLAAPGLARLVQDQGLQDRVVFAGRVPHEDIADYYALMDACPFPRKPWPVCELVSPLKPFEAMALEKAVLVSSVAAMAEMVEEGINGRVIDKGSVEALAAGLARLIDDLPGAAALGRRARQWVRERRTWRQSAQAVERAYHSAMQRHQAAGKPAGR
jgi:glycosyltransferase involved in cell wall biosynthesis